MHQPEVPDLIGLLLACRSPEPVPPPPPAPQTMLWRLSGRVGGPEGLASAPPFAGAEALRTRCDSVTPCVAEQWRSEQGDTVTLLHAGESVVWETQSWPAAWRRLGTELSHCLSGDPLALPPGGDPAGFRTLAAKAPPESDREAMWVLSFSGQNSCELSGTLRLHATRDRADSSDLLSGGKPWDTGGREHALSLLRLLYDLD